MCSLAANNNGWLCYLNYNELVSYIIFGDSVKIKEEIKLYILSLAILFLIVLLITFDLSFLDSVDNCSIPLECAAEKNNSQVLLEAIKSNWLPVLMAILISYCFFIKYEFEHKLDGGAGDSLNIIECESQDYEYLTFLATYIIPFFGFSFTEIGRLLAYAVLLVVIGIIFVKTEKYYANPTLAVFGYRIYKVTLTDGTDEYKSVVAITKGKLSSGNTVKFKNLSENVFFVRSFIDG